MPDQSEDLDEEQRNAVEAPEFAIAVLAGPGSGKTRTLAHRARHLLRGAGASRALLLTFTNKAAAEMKTRALGTAIVSSDRIEASTFHGFGVRFLRSHGEQLGIASDFEIIDPEEEKVLARAVAAAAGVANRLNAWQHARKRGLGRDGRTEAFGAAYEAAKREQGLVDFDDLVVVTGTILAENAAIAAAYGSRFQHVLVDEFQDTNAAQFQIVSALAPHVASISVFADDDQAIFRFVGAEFENIARFVDELAATVYPLTCNYRCRNEIVAYANALISCDPRSSRRMRAHKDGGSVTLRRYASTEQEAQALAEEITGRLAAGAAPASVAVLVRSGYRANDLVTGLRAKGLPVSDWRGDTYQPAGRRTFIAAMSCLRGTLNNRQAERLCDLIGIEDTGERDTDAFLHAAQERPVAAGLLQMRALAFAGENAHAVARQAQRAVAAADPATASMLVELVDAVADFQEHDAQFTLDDLLADLVLGGGGRPPTVGGGIKVATLHKTKGLEWPTVFMLGLEEGHMPDYKCEGEDQLLEERRLCFVGVCRAEDELILTFAQRFRSHSRSRSPFLGEMGARG
jgi:DNA helicase II / ATP-dependent DNA helicase PcrA